MRCIYCIYANKEYILVWPTTRSFFAWYIETISLIFKSRMLSWSHFLRATQRRRFYCKLLFSKCRKCQTLSGLNLLEESKTIQRQYYGLLFSWHYCFSVSRFPVMLRSNLRRFSFQIETAQVFSLFSVGNFVYATNACLVIPHIILLRFTYTICPGRDQGRKLWQSCMERKVTHGSLSFKKVMSTFLNAIKNWRFAFQGERGDWFDYTCYKNGFKYSWPLE